MDTREIWAIRFGPQVDGDTVEGLCKGQADVGTHHTSEYLRTPDYWEVGSVLLVPTYRLEEVEEIIEPEKPGVPVEPYVGLSWKFNRGWGEISCVILEVLPDTVWYAHQFKDEWVTSHCCPLAIKEGDMEGYPRTPSTPAVTRRQKKWVKIDHPEVSSDGIA